jgi:hypothetical protein
MANKWLAHVKKTMKRMKSKGTYKKGMGLKQVIQAAKKTYHKSKRGGGESASDEEKPAPMPEGEGGRRRRRHTRRHRR